MFFCHRSVVGRAPQLGKRYSNGKCGVLEGLEVGAVEVDVVADVRGDEVVAVVVAFGAFGGRGGRIFFGRCR